MTRKTRNKSQGRPKQNPRNKNKKAVDSRHQRGRPQRKSHSEKPSKKSRRMSDHFNKKDFMCKDSKTLRISLGLVGALELLRTKANNRITIEKGYESPETYEKKGSFKRSFHTMGLAANITIDNLSLEETFKLAEEIDEFKGLGLNYHKKHVHVDTRKEDERIMWVTTDKNEEISVDDETKKKYIDGY